MRYLILIFVSVFLIGCSVNTVTLAPEYSHKFKRSAKASKLSEIAKCSYRLDSFSDARASKSFGVVALTIVEGDVEQWVLSALEQYNIDTASAKVSPYVKVTLLKAYIHSLMTSMAANVVLKVEYLPEKSEQNKIVYVRGHEVDVNWNSGEDEILVTLNKAMGKAISKARVELDKAYCS